jgi:hypothetical protein
VKGPADTSNIEKLLHLFPRLEAEGFRVTSPSSVGYNCFAWAATESHRWWEPDPQSIYFWPEGAPRSTDLIASIMAFEALGYERVESAIHEEGFEKVAILVDSVGEAVHATRQLSDGRWTSKMDIFEDIEHGTPEALTGDVYDRVAAILRRPTPSHNSPPPACP